MQAAKTIISVHIPKTGGTSLAAEIKDGAFEPHKLDYDDRPSQNRSRDRLHRFLNRARVRLSGRSLLRKYRIIHGHFYVRKYAFLYPRADFITFMREPVSRVVSAYYYLKYTASQNPHAVGRNPQINLIVQNQMDLVEFARQDVMKEVYCRFTCGLMLEQFTLIGITERFTESIEVLNKLFGLKLIPRHERHTGYPQYASEYQKVRDELREANRENSRIYEEALRLFERRLAVRCG